MDLRETGMWRCEEELKAPAYGLTTEFSERFRVWLQNQLLKKHSVVYYKLAGCVSYRPNSG